VRTAWFWFIALLSTAVTVLVLAGLSLFPRRSRLIHACTRAWGRSLVWAAGVRLHVEGEVPAGAGPFLIVANHTSMLDIPVCLSVIGIDFRFVSRPFFFKVPIMGWGMHIAGHVALDPKRPREAARILRDLAGRIAGGSSLLLFPEGTRSRDGSIGRYKRGPFLAAVRTGAPILPVSIEGLHAIMPPGVLRVHGGPVRVRIGEAIETGALEPSEAGELAKRVESWARLRSRPAPSP